MNKQFVLGKYNFFNTNFVLKKSFKFYFKYGVDSTLSSSIKNYKYNILKNDLKVVLNTFKIGPEILYSKPWGFKLLITYLWMIVFELFCISLMKSVNYVMLKKINIIIIIIIINRWIMNLTLNLGGSILRSLTRIDRPISVAILQCGIVGVNSIDTRLVWLSTYHER